jgi:HSP20 family molecular chaperone IbpA
VLWIKANQDHEEKDDKKKFYRKASNSFSYRLSVPGEVDAGKEPVATYKNGIMKIAFEKSPEAQPKRITVKAE